MRIRHLAVFTALAAQFSYSQSYLTTTVAGSNRLLDGQPAKTVPLRYPYGIAQDSAGNVYFADSDDNRIRKVDANGIISTVAGTGQAGFSGDGGPAIKAELDSPQGVKLDGKGNLYIADYNNNRVRKIVLATGVITTIAGSDDYHYSGDGKIATSAGLDPFDIAVDSAGNVYVADYFNNRVRKVSATDGTISTIAGTGVPGDGDNIAATQAALYGPRGISVDASGFVYFLDEVNNRIKRIDQANNKISTVAGTGDFGYGEPQLDGDGGLATKAFLTFPYSTAIDSNGNLLITCVVEVWRVTLADGKIHFIAGSDSQGFGGDGGAPTSAKFLVPLYIAGAPNGDILLADVGNQRIRRIHNGIIDTLAGTSILDNISATTAFLNDPDGLALDSKGNLVIADTGDSRIRYVAPSGTINALLGTGARGTGNNQLYFPSGTAFDAQGTMYIADTANNRVMRVPVGGSATVFAGGNGAGYSGDGKFAPQARLAAPSAVAADPAGNVYIADSDNFVIRMVDANQNISTFAGTGNPKATGDNNSAKNAGLSVYDLAIFNGALYFSDILNSRIRKIDLSTKIITTVAGIGTPGYSGDGGSPLSAQLSLPLGIAFDAAGNLYIADAGNSVIRMVSGSKITTIAGNGAYAFNMETGTALGVSIDPSRIAVGKDGTIYFTDRSNDRVRKLVPQTAATLSIFSGNNASGVPGKVLPITVKVVDAAGVPVGNVAVSFSIVSGSATLANTTVTTDGTGVAGTQVTLGQTAGVVTITASASKLASVTFSLTINPGTVTTPGPQLTSVQGSGFSTPLVVALSTGGIATVKGQNFGAGPSFVSVASSDLVGGKVPTNFRGICVVAGGARAPIFGASDTQINFQSPAFSASSVDVSVISGCDTANSIESNKMTVPVQPATPEFFYATNNSDGHNPVIATDSLTGTLLVASNLFPGAGFLPAHPGQYVTLYGTGFGGTNPPVAPGVFGSTLAPVIADSKVTLNGRDLPAANVQYVGLTPGSPGLYQVNILLPDDTPDGDLSIVLTIGGASSSPGGYLTVQHVN